MKVLMNILTAAVLLGTGLNLPINAQEAEQLPGLEWAVRAGGPSGLGGNGGLGIAVDSEGYSIVTGYFRDTATFGSGAGQVALTSAGEADAFVARYDPDGKLDWAVRAGGAGNDRGKGVAVDSNGNAVVIGECIDTVTFGNGEDEVILNCEGSMNVFVSRYKRDGSLDWVVRGRGFARGWAVTIDANGYPVVTGAFGGTLTLGIGEPNETTLPSTGSVNFFVARYDPNGILDWATSARGRGYIAGWGVAASPSDGVVISGYCEGGPLILGNGDKEITTECAGGGQKNVFLARYDGDGALDWITKAGGSGVDSGWGISVDKNGYAVVTGSFQSEIIFGSGIDEIVLTAAGQQDIFIARYAPGGSIEWAVTAGGAGVDGGESVAVDSDGHLLATGYYSGNAVFGDGDAKVTLNAAGQRDAFVARYLADGTLDWAVRAWGPYSVSGQGVALDATGHASVTGQFGNSVTFGSGADEVTLTTDIPGRDIFIARYRVAPIEVGALEVVVDIMPGSDSNPVHLPRGNYGRSAGGGGVIPVAILSSDSFDVKQVQPATLSLGDPELDGLAYRLTRPVTFTDVNQDGLADLLVHFSRRELVLAGAINENSEILELSGQTLDGRAFYGRDGVRIVP